MSKMTDKVTPNTMKTQYDHQWNVFVRKNHDYGNSFEKSLDTFGLVAGIVRMNDKFERLLSLTGGDKDALVASESLVDTLEDLSNYAAMAACWMKRKHEQDWKESRNIIGVKLGRGNGKSASVQQAIKEAIDKEIDLYSEIDQDKLFEISNKLIDNMTVGVGGDIKIEDNPKDHKEFIRNTIKQITDTVLEKERKDELLVYMDISDDAGRIAKCVVDNNIPRNEYMGIISRYWHSRINKVPVELREFIYGVLNRHIYYMKKVRDMAKALDNHHMNANKIKAVPLLGGENEEDRKIAEAAKHIDDMLEDIRKRSGGSIETRFVRNPFRHKPDFDIKLDLEPYLKEHAKKCDEKRLDQAIDLFKYHAAAQAKTQEDIDELFERMLDGSLVSRVVNNGDGTYVAYWEPAKKEEDDEC